MATSRTPIRIGLSTAIIGITLIGRGGPGASGDPGSEADFSRDVRPILAVSSRPGPGIATPFREP